ncbi:MAG: SDR family NAD(P)-dependent oxidoreductase [Candidatus Bathyarchaeota archaeon]
MSVCKVFKKVLVTGGAGFIGSHLADVLVGRGFDVVVLDNLSTGKVGNIKRHLKNAHFSFVKGDLRSGSVVDKVVRGVDVVFHLAAITSVPFSVRFPKVTWEVNVDGTRKILEACLRHGVKRFIFASSCAVYGMP